MLRLYSKGCEYLIRCLSEISGSDCGNGFSIEAICKRAGTPKWFSRKIFQALAKKGVLVTKRGPGGGYHFRIHPSKVSILKVIQAIDGKNAFSKCIMRSSKCRGNDYCSLHPIWDGLKTSLINQLSTNTIDQLMKK
ncbi:MAG: Rrf2 family transcriptional regulator [Candidatus Omnitrophica bacterium]|nr:Rrf2 family transcriptional regulator [Candidatus Omnitrophota bacterium]